MRGQATGGNKGDGLGGNSGWIGRVLPIYWFYVNVNAKSYLNMLKSHAMSTIQGKEGLWFQQDGVQVQTTNEVLDFLKSKFKG